MIKNAFIGFFPSHKTIVLFITKSDPLLYTKVQASFVNYPCTNS